jgi:hypothetical protein
VCVLKLSCGVLGFSHEKEGLFAFLSHFLFAVEEILHDFLELFLESISFSLEKFVTFFSCSYFLFE